MRFRRHQEAAQASTRRLIALFLVSLLGLVLALNAALALAYKASTAFAAGYPPLFFETNTALALLFVLGGCWFESLRLREGGAHVARMVGGRPAQASGHTAAERLERRFVNIVQEMALASCTPPPAAWVLPNDDAINAFAAGWGGEDAVVAVTRGALERLTREELQGVVAHEFAHLAHGDTQLNMRLIGLVWGLQMVFGLGRVLAAEDERGRRPMAVMFGIALMAVGGLGWVAGRALQAAVSRQREFNADASAVQYTRLHDGLGNALRKIAHQHAGHADRLRSTQSSSVAHLMFNSPSRWGGWWATHPPLAERLRRLSGHDPGPLPAQPLPPPTDDEPLVALSPRTQALPAGDVQAPHHDATQSPAVHGAAAQEAEALERVSRWRGPGELHAALLALVADASSPQQWTAWSAATAHLHVAAAMRHDIEQLGPAARQRALVELARVQGHAPRLQRRALLHATRHCVATPAGALRWLALRHLMRARPPRLPAPGPNTTLVALRAEAKQVGAWLGLGRGNPGPGRRAPAAWRAAARLQRRLSGMQRPLLLRQWRDAGLAPGAVACVALLLDLELPQ